MGDIGYKVFNPDWTCRGFQYEVGKTFKHDGDIRMCGSGFHFCRKVSDCFNYYDFSSTNKVASVEAIGDVITEGDKSVTNEIKIIAELTWHEVLDICNSGRYNTGRCNTGDYNSGSYNTGNCNIGRCNTGDWNTGVYNSGRCNTGDWNTGHGNTGDYNSGSYNTGGYNSGSYNSGSYNTGYWNSTDNNTGYFNSVRHPIYMFNKPIDISRSDIINNVGYRAMCHYFNPVKWATEYKMTEEEKGQHPEYLSAGGYTKRVDYKTACKIMWDKMSDEEKSAVKELPNFDADVFKEITGIHVD